MFKYLLPYDVFERHKKVGSLISQEDTVVDIGGELNHLSQFCSPKKIVVANLASGDVIITKGALPFKKKSFDVACAIDVLEHIPKIDRKKFIENLINISSKKAILSFPIATTRHNQYERETLDWLKKIGKDVNYLEEHIKFGLPEKTEIEELTESLSVSLTYSGDITLNKIMFRIFMFDPKIKYLRRIIYFIKKIFNFFSNEILYLILSDKNYSESVNRAYLIIKTVR